VCFCVNDLYISLYEYDDFSRYLRGDFLPEDPEENIDLMGNANVSTQNQVVGETNVIAQECFTAETICLEKILTFSENPQKVNKRKFDVFTPDILDARNTSNEEGCSNKVFKSNVLTSNLEMKLGSLVAKAQQEQCPTIKSHRSLSAERRIQLIKLVEKYGNRWAEFAIILHCNKVINLKSVICNLIQALEVREGCCFNQIDDGYAKLIKIVEQQSISYLTPALEKELDDLVLKAQQEQCPTIKLTRSLTAGQWIQLIKMVEKYGNRWKEFAIILHCERGDMLKKFIGRLIKSLEVREGFLFDKIVDGYSKLVDLVRKKKWLRS
jgi:hypothetical protein